MRKRTPGPSCSKLTTSLVNDSLKFKSSDTQICWNFLLKNVSSFCSAKATHIFLAKNIGILYIESAKTVNEMTLNELVKLTTLWTTGPRCILESYAEFIVWPRGTACRKVPLACWWTLWTWVFPWIWSLVLFSATVSQPHPWFSVIFRIIEVEPCFVDCDDFAITIWSTACRRNSETRVSFSSPLSKRGTHLAQTCWRFHVKYNERTTCCIHFLIVIHGIPHCLCQPIVHLQSTLIISNSKGLY